jgi:hypothetical protein
VLKFVDFSIVEITIRRRIEEVTELSHLGVIGTNLIASRHDRKCSGYLWVVILCFFIRLMILNSTLLIPKTK